MSEQTTHPGFFQRIVMAVTRLFQYLHRIATHPVGELNKAQRNFRYAVDLARHCTRALRYDRAGEMAAALTYRTVFSLVPVVIVTLIIIKSFSGDLRSQMLDPVLQNKMFNYVGLDIIAGAGAGRDDTSAVTVQGDESTRGTVDKALVDRWAEEIATRIDQVSFTSIGVVGVALLIWAALGLAVTVENSFNRIYNCPTGRPWMQRITIYWSVMTLAPLLALLSVYFTSFLVAQTEGVGVFNWLWRLLAPFGGVVATWVLLFLLYILMPNTKVRRRPALIGSFVAAVLWELAKYGFKLYVTKALLYSALYGSLALIPFFLLWLYVTWLIVLFGFELTYTLQAMQGKRFKYDREGPQITTTDPYWTIPIMAEIARSFMEGKGIGQQQLADRLHLPSRAVAQVAHKLETAGLIHHITGKGEEESGYSMSLPPESVPMTRVLEVARQMTTQQEQTATTTDSPASPGWAYFHQLSLSLDKVAAEATLATLVKTNPQP